MLRCDNKNAVRALINRDIRDKRSHSLVVQICEMAMKYHFRYYIKHIKGTTNTLADALSRLKITKFKDEINSRNVEINDKPEVYDTYPFDFGSRINHGFPKYNIE